MGAYLGKTVSVQRERGRTPILFFLSSPTTAITPPIYGYGVMIASRTVPPNEVPWHRSLDLSKENFKLDQLLHPNL